jgi:hypothetical protein
MTRVVELSRLGGFRRQLTRARFNVPVKCCILRLKGVRTYYIGFSHNTTIPQLGEAGSSHLTNCCFWMGTKRNFGATSPWDHVFVF